jgi:hypothetical protein
VRVAVSVTYPHSTYQSKFQKSQVCKNNHRYA